MAQTNLPTSMRNFIIVWLGQMGSNLGSSMSGFAISIWAWQFTGQVTTLALVDFFTLLPGIFITPISGVIVDRCDRKLLMIIGDTVAIIATIVILLLQLSDRLQIWHFYVSGVVVGIFNQFQWLAYSASVTLMVPKQQYTRASSMEFVSGYGANILAPPLAGFLYPVIGLAGILCIDLVTFAIAVSSILFVNIPKPSVSEAIQDRLNIWHDLGFGLRYLKARKGLLALLLIGLLFVLPHDISDALYAPMILSHTENNTVLLGSLASAAGLGGVTGALISSAWGGPKRRIRGVLFGMVGAGLSKTVFGLGQSPLVWILAQFCSSLNFPVSGSCETAIWLAKVAPNVQGRVFAARSLLEQLVSAVAYLIAGPLSDHVFKPAMMPGGSLAPILGGVFGTNAGSGISLMYVLCALSMMLVGLWGYNFHMLRDVEAIIPDSDRLTG
ncbi:MFS transporter [Hydrococcus rivularis NIES-593]|uniref:MFS transporter n=1 Tax=Hydrococcus rivularis NIES-593 TaxID=1921803 RepID=A0A1U7HBA8_9CYAN|nr:MFS transporter [Hydrococcus rivularis]OKH20877.1 MFS transporter [Hydrococcus rivularis NIES-593]